MNDGVPASVAARARRGRWIAGVCAGLAGRWGLPVRTVRIAFVLATFVALLGPLVYLAFFVILPPEGTAATPPGIRILAWLAGLLGVLAGLAALGAASVVVTLLGAPGIVVAAAGLTVVVAAVAWRGRVRPWLLLPIAALTLPGAVAAATRVTLSPTLGATRWAPDALSASAHRVRGGVGPLEIDLRRTRLARDGVVGLDIRADGRTIVALPHDRCVHVVVARPSSTLPARALRSIAAARSTMLFGRSRSATDPSSYGASRRGAPTLRVTFTSLHHGLTIRDYPDSLDPTSWTGWPGFYARPVAPDTALLTRADAARLRAQYRYERSHARQLAARNARNRAGPCAQPRGTR